MFAWKDPLHADKVAVAEDLIRSSKDYLSGLIKPAATSRALHALAAESSDLYANILNQIPQILIDNPKEIAALEIAKKLINKESSTTRGLSFGPGIEFHHWMPNNSISDAMKYLSTEGMRDFHLGLRDNALHPGTHPYSGVPLSKYGHREGPNSAHRDPITGRNFSKYWGVKPLELPMPAFGKSGPGYVEEVVKAYVTQKADPSIRLAIEVFDREKPLRDKLSKIIGMDVLLNPAQSKQALRDARVTEEDVTRLAMATNDAVKSNSTERTTMDTKNIWNVRQRPDIGRSYRRVLRM